MSLTDVLQWAYARMEYPWVFIFVIPAIFVIYWLLKKEYFVIKEDPEVKLQKRKVRKLMLFTRSLIVILLLIALSSPFVQKEKTIEGDPSILLLVDNSTSMELFEDFTPELAARLEKKMNTEVKHIGAGTVSNIGDSILSELQPHGSILLYSDGAANSGANMGDVALYASKLNATVNAIQLSPSKNDAHVYVFGPAKTLEDSDNTFTVVVGKAGNIGPVHLKVTLDGETIFDQFTPNNVYEFTKKLPQGTHRITATIDSQDYWPQNNVFYKTVRVVPKPKILFYTEKGSPSETLLKQLYVVDTATSLPSSLKDYYAVIINDINADKLDQVTDVLNDFVADGNGMVVFGGENSYEKGGYKGSLFETLLPVFVGAPEKKEGDTAIAIVIDISGSAGAPFGRFASTADFEKAASIGILQGLRTDTEVSIIAFNTQAYLISAPSKVFEKAGLEDIITRIKWGGGTNVAAGLLKSISLLADFPGSKNIVLLSDGKTQNEPSAIEAARYAANAGIKIYTIGVGPSTNEGFMMDVAELTNGIYFRATEETRLNILFGPVDEQEVKTGTMGLVILNKNHFITENFDPNATIYGFNQVSPKGAGRLLATTSTGDPILTVWRLGLGRIASIATDDGGKWAGNLLGASNSRIITRTVNWAIGDPERKSASFIDAKDTRLNEPAEITVKSGIPPTASNAAFYKIDEDTYTASILPSQQGFQEVAGATFAVNYELEYASVGQSSDLEKIVRSTGGKIFDRNDIDGIVDKAKSTATRIINSRTYVRWPFMVLAIILFIVEIFIRRIVRKE